MTRDEVTNRYFDWLCDLVSGHRRPPASSYDKLLMHLHTIEFRYLLPMDRNRAMDGMDMRWRFACDNGWRHVPDCLDGPCSVLEMMVALAVHCEEDIMDNPMIGNRTGQWFWDMVVNLGLGGMTDIRFDVAFVDDVIERFLNREYEPDGRGGLFTVRHCNRDLRHMEIQHQQYWYLNTIT